ncbi:MAG: MFS transporter, partial [Holophagales bacterium]|nr:MFS transporter [Holophagales bacterium]
MSTSRPAETRNASALLRDGLVWDNHGCMPVGRPHDTSFLPQLRRYRSAGVDAVMLNVGFGDMGVEEHLRTLADMRHWLKARPDEYVLIGTADDVERARATGRLAVGFDIEGANAIADQPSLIETYYDLGVRWMLLAYNRNNRVGGGCQDEDTGLTAYGREVIAEMERVGMQVCCSHTGYRTVRDVFEVVTKPVIFSHSNARAVHAHPRNVPDDLIRACAATGGVVGLNGLSVFLGPGEDLVETFVRHVEHVVSSSVPARRPGARLRLRPAGAGRDPRQDARDLPATRLRRAAAVRRAGAAGAGRRGPPLPRLPDGGPRGAPGRKPDEAGEVGLEGSAPGRGSDGRSADELSPVRGLRAVFSDYVEAARAFSQPARLLVVSVFLVWVARGIQGVLFNLYLVEAGHQAPFVGRALAMTGAGIALAALPAGLFAERWGRRRCLMLGLAAEGIGLLLRALVTDPGAILALSFLGGAGQSLYQIAALPFLTEHSGSRERTHLFSVVFSAALLAGV